MQGGNPAKIVRKGATTGAHRPVSIDRHPKINGSGIQGSLPFHEKYVAIRKKVFGSTPFSKGVAGLQGGKPCKENRVQGGESCKERWVVERGSCKKYKNKGGAKHANCLKK